MGASTFFRSSRACSHHRVESSRFEVQRDVRASSSRQSTCLLGRGADRKKFSADSQSACAAKQLQSLRIVASKVVQVCNVVVRLGAQKGHMILFADAAEPAIAVERALEIV